MSSTVGAMLSVTLPVAPPTTFPNSSYLPGQPPAGQRTFVPGAHQDPADFYGLFGAVLVMVAVIFVIRRAFRPRRRPTAARPRPSAVAGPDGTDGQP